MSNTRRALAAVANRKPLSHTRIHEILDAVAFGDHVTIVRRNGATMQHLDGRTMGTPGRYQSAVTGPAVVGRFEQAKTVGIDLFDGAPHLIRDELGATSGDIIAITVEPLKGTK